MLILPVLHGHEARAEQPYQIDWSMQFGTATYDTASGVVVDDTGHVYLSGWGGRNLFGAGTLDIQGYLVKLDPTGSVIWQRQTDRLNRAVARDSQGNIYTGGGTADGFYLDSAAEDSDAFLTKYDSLGNELWDRQFGHTAFHDNVYSIGLDPSDNVYLAGNTNSYWVWTDADNLYFGDGFIKKYDPAGAELWYHPTSTTASGNGVTVDHNGHAFMAGTTGGDLAGTNENPNYDDTFLIKYDSAGVEQWAEQYGTPGWESGGHVTVDDMGNSYLLGRTNGSLGGPTLGEFDVFLKKIDPTGTELWSRQIGTTSRDGSGDVAIDSQGNVFITGWTAGSLAAQNMGWEDLFLMKLDPLGNELWSYQIGSNGTESATSLAIDAQDNVYISGQTLGDLAGVNEGNADAFLIKFAVPEPATLALLAVGGFIAGVRRPGAGCWS